MLDVLAEVRLEEVVEYIGIIKTILRLQSQLKRIIYLILRRCIFLYQNLVIL